MSPQFYFDVEVPARGSLPVIARLMQVLHGMQRERPGLFALAFPRLRKGISRHPGNLVRLFSDTLPNLEQVKLMLQKYEQSFCQVLLLPVNEVPSNYQGEWVEYRRVRIPGKGSRLAESRSSKLATAENLPFIQTSSRTNGQGFSLHIDAIPGVKTTSCEPDSYGLSVSTRAFTLPAI